MEPVFAFLANGWGYVSLHLGAFGLLLGTYLLVPGLITKFFTWLEELVNKIKFTIGGFTVDFSKYEWDDDLNAYLRDYTISLMGKADVIKQGVASGTVDAADGDAQLEALTHETVAHFLEDAPTYLRKFAEEKYGANKVALAEFLVLKVKGILFDVKSDKALQKKKL